MPYRTVTSVEYIELVAINIKVKVRNFIDFFKVVFKYYPRALFRKIDLSLLSSYVFDNPFQISKRFMLFKGEEDVYTYGETPLPTLELIAKQCRLKSFDRVFELGCGRGRTCFWLNQWMGCSVVGVDYVPEFINRAFAVKEKYQVTGVEFRLEDILTTNLEGATVIYLYGICYSDAFIEQLIHRFESLPQGTKVITVSYSLQEYLLQAPFEILKKFPAPFTWGTADVYLQVKL